MSPSRPLVVVALALGACRSHDRHEPPPPPPPPPLPELDVTVFTQPIDLDDPRHAHLGWHDVARDGEVSVQLRPDGIYRQSETLIARSFPSDGRKSMVLDDDRVYWIEPAAMAVLSVAIAGGPVSFVCQTDFAIDDDLAIHGDTLYVVDVGGELDAVDKHGGPRREVGFLGSRLPSARNGMWMRAGDDGLYIVATVMGSSSEPGDEGAMRIAYPSEGTPAPVQNQGLLFAPTPALLQERPDEVFAAIADDVKAGRAIITVSVTSAIDADSFVQHLHTLYGPGVRTEVVVTPPPPGTVPSPWTVIDAGVSPEHVAALFAPVADRR